MKFFLISDDHDTLVGMRLAGIDGVAALDKREVEEQLALVVDDESVGIVLITEKLAAMAKEQLDDIKLNRKRPLVLTVPDRNGMSGGTSITDYIREAIGVKL